MRHPTGWVQGLWARPQRVCVLLMLIASCGGPPLPPNILLITADDLNNDLGTYGHGLVQSPHIDRLAEQGVRFDRAYCQYPVCSPSRSSFLTGLYPEQTGVLTNQGQFRERLPDVYTLPQWFKNHGYFAARVGKIYHYNVPMQIGTDGMDDPESWSVTVNPRGIDREIHDRIHTLVPGQFGGTLSWLSVDIDEGLHTDELATEAALRIMEEHHPKRTGAPLFLAVGYYRPHTPFVAPDSFFAMYPIGEIQPLLEVPGDRDDIPVPALADRPRQRDLTLEQRQEIIQAYYASVSFLDAQVGRLLEALEAHDLADNTIIVFVSDHGYHLGHHGLWQKGRSVRGIGSRAARHCGAERGFSGCRYRGPGRTGGPVSDARGPGRLASAGPSRRAESPPCIGGSRRSRKAIRAHGGKKPRSVGA